MSLSSGSPGSMRFCTPSRPAIIIAANARYGLHDGSGGRNSTRLALGLAEYIGMRTAADRFRREYARLRTTYLYSIMLSADLTIVSNFWSISHCPAVATS